MKSCVQQNALLVLALCAGLLLSGPPPVRAVCVETGQESPEIALADLEGEPVALSQLRGKVVLLAFWASWCPRCMEELAFLQGLYTGFSGQLEVLAINQETQNLSATHVAKLKEEIAGLGIEFPVLLDKDLEVWKSYCINALPTSVVVDQQGRVRFVEPNYYWASQKKIKAVLQELGVGRP